MKLDDIDIFGLNWLGGEGWIDLLKFKLNFKIYDIKINEKWF